MKQQHNLEALVALLPLLMLTLAGQSAPPRQLVIKPMMMGEKGTIFPQDFATPTQLRGFRLLKAGKQAEAQTLFARDILTDLTGLAAVGLAQATPPAQWAGQITELESQLNRKQSDVRLAFRLGLLMYYHSISRSKNLFIRFPDDQKEFHAAALLLTDLWKRTQDPLTGMLLTQLAFRATQIKEVPRPQALLETLVGTVGGRETQSAFAQAKRTGFAIGPPSVSMVGPEKRNLLVGVLTGLWSEAHIVPSEDRFYNNKGNRVDRQGKILPDDKQNEPMAYGKLTEEQTRELAYIDKWINQLNPDRKKLIALVAQTL